MYTSNTWLLLLFLLTTTLVDKSTSFNKFCFDTAVFANNSAYQTNLNTLFRSLSSNATNNPSGYHQAQVNDPISNETIYGHYLCRGDQSITSCNNCVTTATTTDLPTACPNRKVAIIYYDECMVRYSNDSFFGKRDESPSTTVQYSSTDLVTGDANRFMDMVDNFISNVIAVRASDGGRAKKFSTGLAKFSSFQTTYALGQCTPDLSKNDCYVCLNSTIQTFKQASGNQLLTPSCFVRYENHPFFNLSYLSPPVPPSELSPSNNSNPAVSPMGSRGKKNISTKAVVSIVVSVVVATALLLLCLRLLKFKLKKGDIKTNINISDQDFTTESLQYDLATLLSSTDNFSDENKLGEGGFGSVYKGTLSNGQLIAVKRLSASSSQGIQEFKTEALLVAKLQHRNLLRLLGFCYTSQEKLLVYEHVANKSLDKYLFDQENRRQLDWKRRFNIIRGIARGLVYLHHDSQLRIIHRDLKASNILLDSEMNAKISDFGTSRIFGVDQTQSNYTNRVVGTYGYMAPEYALHGQFSIKSDVYSFGVLILEIISGRRNDIFNKPNGEDLISFGWKQWKARTPLEFVDRLIIESCSDDNEVMRCLNLGLLCVQESAEDRRTMANVVLTLESYSVTLPIPQQPDLIARTRLEYSSKEDVSDNSSSKTTRFSLNDVSVTEPAPR